MNLKQELLENKLRPIYVFSGEELALQDVYINKIKEISGLDTFRVQSVNSIINILTMRTLISSKPKIYIVRNDDDYVKTSALWEKLLSRDNLRGNILILLYSGGETSEFIKKHNEIRTVFEHIGTNILVNRLEATTTLSRPYCEELVRICSNDYGRIKHELYKLQMLCGIMGYSMQTAFIEARKNNFIHEDVGDIIFDFTNAIIEKKIAKAYDLLAKIWDTDDGSSIKLLSVLYTQFRQILMIQTTQYKERTEEVLGLPKGTIYVISQKCDIYNAYELVNIIKLIRYLEKGIKTGIVEDRFALDYLLSQIW